MYNSMYNAQPMTLITSKKTELSPDFIAKRLKELIGNNFNEVKKNFYNNIYIHFFQHTGLPIQEIYNKDKVHEDMLVGDVIAIDEIGHYSRLYQKVPKILDNREFLIIEQWLDTTPVDKNIWCHIVPKNISVTTHFNKLEDSNFILDLNSLYENDQYLYNHFLNYLEKHNRLYVDYLLSFIINEKVEIIKKQCIKWDKLVELCWYDFINT
jgi:hypothetical protein